MRDKEGDRAASLWPPDMYVNMAVSSRDPNMGSTARYSPSRQRQQRLFAEHLDKAVVYTPPMEDMSQYMASYSVNVANVLPNDRLAPLLQAIDDVSCNTDIVTTDIARAFYPPPVFNPNETFVLPNGNEEIYLSAQNSLSEIPTAVPLLDTATDMQLIYSTEDILNSVESTSDFNNANAELVAVKEENSKLDPQKDVSLDGSESVHDIFEIHEEFSDDDMNGFENRRGRTKHANSDVSITCIPDKSVPSRAKASLPVSHLLLGNCIENESNILGVFARRRIPIRARFGPLEGVLHPFSGDAPLNNPGPQFLIQLKDQKFYVDLSDEKTSNWMRFVRFSPGNNQNVSLQQSDDNLYFTSIRPIPPHSELVLGYSKSYAKHWGLPYESHDGEDSIEWSCYECSMQFTTSIELQNHLDAHENFINNEHVDDQECEKKIMNDTHGSNNYCNICNKTFPPTYCLKRHMKMHYSEELIGSDVSQKCSIEENEIEPKHEKCDDAQYNFEDIQMDIESIPINKNIYDDSTNEINNLMDIETTVTNLESFGDIDTNKELPLESQNVLVDNSCDKNKNAINEISDIYCCLCSENFSEQLELTEHLKLQHMEGNGIYICSYCDKKFSHYNAIEKHIKNVHNYKHFTCKHCSMSFNTADKLRVHVAKHSNNAGFACPNCNKIFKRKDKLKEHIKRQRRVINNNKEVIYLCGEKMNGSLSVGNTDNSYVLFTFKCHPCHLGFKRRGMLVNHLARHHPEVSRASVPELQLPIMRKAREYFCQHCDKVYKSSSKRKAHILKNHPGESLPPSSRDLAGSELTEMEALGYSACVGTISSVPHSCPYTPCHKQYASKAKLSQHIRHKHLMDKKDDENFDKVSKCETSIPLGNNNSLNVRDNNDTLSQDSTLLHDKNINVCVDDVSHKNGRPLPPLQRIPSAKFSVKKLNRVTDENVLEFPDGDDVNVENSSDDSDSQNEITKLTIENFTVSENGSKAQNDEMFLNYDRALIDEYLCCGSNYLPLMVLLTNDVKLLEKNDQQPGGNRRDVSDADTPVVPDSPKVHISGHILSVGSNKTLSKSQFLESALTSQYTDR